VNLAPNNTSSAVPAAWFVGAGAVCGIGSLPFLAVAPALEFIARRCPDVPFWPQLRRMSPREAMLPQTFGANMRLLSAMRDEHGFGISAARAGKFFDALERSDAALDPACASGFYAFVEACRCGAFPAARAVKGQLMGPITVACSISADATLFIDNPGFRAGIADYVVRLARWQVDALLKCSSAVLLLLDEAYLGVALRQVPARRDAIVETLKSVILRVRRPGVLVGIHCCDEVPLSIVNEINADLFSFDASHGGAAFAADLDARRFVEGGGHVAWGWIPTLDDLSGVHPDDVVAGWKQAALQLGESDEGVERVRSRSLVTAACGLAGSSIATCERSFELAAQISRGFAAPG
jgi:hypothetical protein